MDEFERFEKLTKIRKAENILETIMIIIGALALSLGIVILICMEKGIDTNVLCVIGFVLIMLYIPIKPIWFMLADAKSNILNEKE